jgi:hypothetical protein
VVSEQGSPHAVPEQGVIAPPRHAPGMAGSPGHVLGLWLSASGGALAWFADLNVRYFMIEAGWARKHELLIIGLGVLALLLTLAALLSSVRQRRSLGADESKHIARLVTNCGVALNAIFALLIAATLLQQLLVDGGGA